MDFDTDGYLRVDAPDSLGASPSGIAFATSTGDLLEVSCCGAGVFRLRVGSTTSPDYGIVRAQTKSCTITQPQFGMWTLSAGDTAFELTGKPLAFRLLHKGMPVLCSSSDLTLGGEQRLPTIGRLRSGEQWAAAVGLPSGEPVYGLGEKFGPLNKRGQLIHSQVEEPAGVNAGLSSRNTPFAWGPGAAGRHGAWGLFVHTPGAVTHGVGHPDWSHRAYVVVVDDEALDLFLFAADTPEGILDRYAQLTGRAPSVPLWSLGLWVSGTDTATPEKAIAFAAELRAHRTACDVLMLDGRTALSADVRLNFEWDPERFAEPRATLAKIKAHGLKVCVSQSPRVSVDAALFEDLAERRFLLTDVDGHAYIVGSDELIASRPGNKLATTEGGIVDFTNPTAFAWWRDAHRGLFADGVDAIGSEFNDRVPDDAIAFNGDVGSRLHNVYPLLYNQCVYEATTAFQLEANARPLVGGRAGWAGSQRFPIQSGGDAQRDWEGLAASIRGGLSWGMSGSPCYAFDIAGVHGAAPAPAELFVRWLQATVFGSHIRLHGKQMPWMYGAEVEAIARKWLAFRYRLIPYLQRTIAQATGTGLPVMRAMALAFPGNALVRDYETQFMCGDALLVAPIVAPGGEVEIALPPGGWHDLNSRRRFAGQRVLRYKAALDQFPVFGREGYSLPLGASVQHTGEIDIERALEQLWVFGRPTQALDGYAQVAIVADADGAISVRVASDIDVQRFGDAEGLSIGVLDAGNSDAEHPDE